MKANIFISYKMIFSVILIIVSIALLITNGVSLFQFYNATEYNDSSLKKGEYVECEIQDYLVKPVDAYHSNVYSGQCQILSLFSKRIMSTISHMAATRMYGSKFVIKILKNN